MISPPRLFLEPGRSYTAKLYRDAADADWQTNPLAYVIEAWTVEAGAPLRIDLAPGGGLPFAFASPSSEV